MATLNLGTSFLVNGKPVIFEASQVYDKGTKQSLSAFMAAAPSKEYVGNEITTAINLMKDGGDGTSLPTDRNTLKKIVDALASTHTLVDTFINGEANDDGVMNRMVELVTQISANKDSIDAILGSKVDVSAIVNDLTTGGEDKVLSSEQGKALKGLIDALQTSVSDAITNTHSHANKETLDAIGKNERGNLTFNGVALGEYTGVATGATLDAASSYTSQIQIVVEEYDPEAAA